jgi:hypothetical protein
MAMHPDAPEDVRGDPDLYARWRVEHADDVETRGLSPEERLAFFRDEWHESHLSSQELARENATIEMQLMPDPRKSGKKPQ